MFINILKREDIFISYSRADGGNYATGLADRLTDKKFSCFMDKLGTEPNKDLPDSLKKQIKNSTLFILVGTERAAVSEFVEKEIKEFLKTSRTIVPIDFHGASLRARWYPLIQGVALEPEENENATKTGEPSDSVIGRIEKSFRYTRRNARMLRILWATLLVFAVLVVASVVTAYTANKNIARARAAEERRQLAEQLEIVANGRGPEAIRTLENLAQLKSDYVFEGIFKLFRHQDPRIAGRSKFLLAHAYRSQLLKKAQGIADSGDVGIANAFIDSLVSIDGTDVDEALWQIANFKGDCSKYPFEDHPPLRALALLFGKDNRTHIDSLWELANDKNRDEYDHLGAAMCLLGTPHHEAAAKILTQSWATRDTPSLAGIIAPRFPDVSSSILNQAVQAENEFDAYAAFNASQTNRIEIAEDLLWKMFTTKVFDDALSNGRQTEAATILIKKRPEEVVAAMKRKTWDPMTQANILIESPVSEHRRKAVAFWLKSLPANEEKSALDEFDRFALRVAQLPEEERAVDELRHLLGDRSPYIRSSAIRVLVGTRAEDEAIEALKQVRAKLLAGGTFYYSVMIESKERDQVLNEMVSLVRDPLKTDMTEGGSVSYTTPEVEGRSRNIKVLRALVLALRSPRKNEMLSAYFNSFDASPSHDVGASQDMVALATDLIPDLANRWRISLGGNYASSDEQANLHGLVVGWWAFKGKYEHHH